jgi:phage/plasmid-associated DNA primase
MTKKFRDQIYEYITNVADEDIPFIKKDRNLSSFRNGLYETNILNEETGNFYERFIPYGTHEYREFDKNRTACKYFDYDFTTPDAKHWRDIPTPVFDRIFDYQFSDEPEKNEIYNVFTAMLGRLRAPIGLVDKFQITLMLKGIAGTGKSTIIEEIVKSMFEDDDIGMIANNGNARFGLEDTIDKFVVVAPEVNENLSLDQTVFQEIVTGGRVRIDVKGKRHIDGIWDKHTIWATNIGIGNYLDASGSISRRILPLIFKNIVRAEDVDTELPEKIAREMPNLIVKLSRSYLEFANKNRGRGIWKIVPKYFLRNKDELTRQTNPLRNFLFHQDRVIFGENIYCKIDHFRDAFKDFCNENAFPVPRWNETFYNPVFKQYANDNGVSIKVEACSLSPRPNTDRPPEMGTFIMGVGLASEYRSGEVNGDSDGEGW